MIKQIDAGRHTDPSTGPAIARNDGKSSREKSGHGNSELRSLLVTRKMLDGKKCEGMWAKSGAKEKE